MVLRKRVQPRLLLGVALCLGWIRICSAVGEGAFPGLESPEVPLSESPAFIPPFGAAALPLGGAGEKRPERHMRNSGFPCEDGGSRGGSPFLPIVHHGGPPPVEVPDWSHGVFDPPPKNAPPQTESRIKIKFLDPFPPPTSAPSLASFSVYGSGKPREPLLLACHPLPEGQASCEVLSNKPFFQIPEESLHGGWSMGEGDRTATSSQHSLSTLAGEGDESPNYPASHSAQGQGLLCCEASSDAENCVTCSGIFNGSYDPLHAAPVAGGFYGPGGGEDEAPFEPTIGDRMPRGSSRKWPHSEDHTEPLSPKDLFKVLPQLQQQLGGAADPEALPCASQEPPPQGVPTLGDVIRSRSDLTLFGKMLETSHIDQLIPCPLTFLTITDDKARDYQGRKPPPCLAAALERPENQANVLKLLGRTAALGKLETLPVGSTVPVLHGKPGTVRERGSSVTWNNIQLSGEKIVFDRGVIFLMNGNDMSDAESRELLRLIVYWSCLHEYLQQNPGLTRLALMMVDNRRALPVLGIPPGPRPAWVARGTSGWFPPPGEAESHHDTHVLLDYDGFSLDDGFFGAPAGEEGGESFDGGSGGAEAGEQHPVGGSSEEEINEGEQHPVGGSSEEEISEGEQHPVGGSSEEEASAAEVLPNVVKMPAAVVETEEAPLLEAVMEEGKPTEDVA